MRVLAILLLALGLSQMAGNLVGLDLLRGLALATAAAPAPRLFSAVDGLEAYSTRFVLEWTDDAGRLQVLDITSEAYARVHGPYNRRNAYGAALAFGPLLAANPATRPVWESVARYALCGDAPLLRELGIDGPVHNVRVRLEPRPGTDLAGRPHVLEAPCAP
jgi:hypothetical protein